MATCVFYIDEAGDPGKHSVPIVSSPTPVFTLAALAMPLEDWRSRDRDYLASKKQFFPDLLAKTRKRPEEWEAKGTDITNPHNATSRRRHAFLSLTLSYVAQHGGTCFAVTFLKNSTTPMPAHNMYTQALQFLVERFSIFIAEHPVYNNGILICDSRMKGMGGSDIAVARSHMSYIFGNATGRQFINILEAPLFADSRLTVGLQIVDIVASVIYTNHYKYHLHNAQGALNYDHMAKYWSSIDQLQFKSKQMYSGYQIYGCKVIDSRRMPIAPAGLTIP